MPSSMDFSPHPNPSNGALTNYAIGPAANMDVLLAITPTKGTNV